MATVALVNATASAMTAGRAAMSRILPDVRTIRVLDEGLLPAFEEAGGWTPPMVRRFVRLLEVAEESNPAAILLTCTIGTAIADQIQPLFRAPIVKPDSAMLSEAVLLGGRIGILTTARPTLTTAREELERLSASSSRAVTISTALAAGAFEALSQGNAEEHDHVIEVSARKLAKEVDVLVLSQMSMADAAGRLTDLPIPVLTSPEAAARAVKVLLALK